MKTGYHVVYARDYYEGIDDARRHGFDFAQFELGVPSFFLDSLSAAQLRAIRDYAESSGVELTFHAPGDNVSLYADYPCVRRGNLEQFKRILGSANALRARHITVHAGERPAFRQSGGKGDDFSAQFAKHYENVLYENLRELLSCAGDVLVCLENYKLTQAAMQAAQRLIDEGQPLYLTLDTAKFEENHSVFYHRNQSAIREMHVHDRNETYGSHQTVGNGNLDFMQFRPFCGPEVYLNFEVRPVAEAAKSKDALKAIWGEKWTKGDRA